jgi:CubicO group peptidase (beta-lactamase class C family)
MLTAGVNTDGTPALKKPARPITIRDLMTHTSGLIANPPPEIGDLYQKLDRTLSEAVTIYAKQPLVFEPGGKWMYSNPGIATLGRIIEVVAGQPFERFMDDRLFRPLGMNDTFLFPPAGKTARIAAVYRSVQGKVQKAGADMLGGDALRFRPGAKYPAPEFGAYSTAADLAAFYEMMRAGGIHKGKRLLSKASVDTMTALHTGNIEPAGHEPGMGYGLAWTVVKDPIGTLNLLSIGTYGHGGAFGTAGWIDKAKEIVGVYLVQGGPGTSAGRNALMQIAAGALTE